MGREPRRRGVGQGLPQIWRHTNTGDGGVMGGGAGQRLAKRGSGGGQENGVVAGSGEPLAVAFLREAVGTAEDAGGGCDGGLWWRMQRTMATT